MTDMQLFYQTYLSGDRSNSYAALADIDPGEIDPDDLLIWDMW